MGLYVLDTDTFSMLIGGQQEVCRRVVSVPTEEIAVTIVTVDESLTGWYTQLRRARDDESLVRAFAALQRVVEHLREVRILPFDASCAALAREFRTNDRRVGTNDLRIAANASIRNATLVTRNAVDFSRFANLLTEDWSMP